MTDQFKADVLAVEPDMPVYFVFNGKTLVGQKDETKNTRDMQDAGYIGVFDFLLLVRVDVFAGIAPMEVNSLFKIGPDEFRVSGKTTSQDGVMFMFACVDGD